MSHVNKALVPAALTSSNLNIGVIQVSPSTFTSSFPTSSPNKLSVKNSGKSPFHQSASLGRATLGIPEGRVAAAGDSTTEAL